MNQDRDSLIDGASQGIPILTPNYDRIETHPENDHPQASDVPTKKFRQFFAGFSATLSALSAGAILGWTSPIFSDLTGGRYNGIHVNASQMGWIGSFVTLGAAAMCIPTGFICDLVGRKKALLLLMMPFLMGWSLIVWAEGVVYLYFGRLITGMAVGASCVAAPLYNGEIAHKSVRGALGSCFQLMITVGIFIAYLAGKFLNPFQFTLFCAALPFIFLLSFSFQPESPMFLIKLGKFDEAKSCLILLRGENYDVDRELMEIEGALKENTQSATSIRGTFLQRSVKKAILISFSLMFFQQFSGVNAIVFYASDIVKSTGVKIDPNGISILVAFFQAVATLIASLLIEKLGRKFLLKSSLWGIVISNVLLAIYYSLKDRAETDETYLKSVWFVPVGALCVFVVAFSLGLGPIPWMISSETLPTEIRGVVCSVAGTFNWFLAFLLTKFYLDVCKIVGQDIVYYGFTAFSFVGLLFVMVRVPETKGKSVSEIQDELGR